MMRPGHMSLLGIMWPCRYLELMLVTYPLDAFSVSKRDRNSVVNLATAKFVFNLGDISNPIPMAQRIRARIIVLNIKVPITIGTPVVLHQQSLIEPAAIVKLNAHLNKTTGEVIKKNPRCLGSNYHAMVEIETTKVICIERYDDCKELGRVMLRVGGVTIAAGVVTNILR